MKAALLSLCLLSAAASCAQQSAQLTAAQAAKQPTASAAAPKAAETQATSAQTQAQSAQTKPASAAAETAKPEPVPVKEKDARRAAKIFVQAAKLFQKEQFEAALQLYQQAAQLNPNQREYPLAAEVARNHSVTALLQSAAKARNRGDEPAARAAVAHALQLNPDSEQARQHLNELAAEATAGQIRPLYEEIGHPLGEETVLEHSNDKRSFHLITDTRQLIQQLFKAYNVETAMDESVRAMPIHFDLDDATFLQATQALRLTAGVFYVPIDAHRVLVARDTRENHVQFERQELETVYLAGPSTTEITDLVKMAKEAFGIEQVTADPTASTLTLRGAAINLEAFNKIARPLLDGHSQVLLDVRILQLAHTNERNTGAQLSQSMSAFNLYSEEQSILNANQTAVQEIISSGLASANDPIAIIGILVSTGQISDSLLTSGIATFGGGLTWSGLAPGTSTLNLALNSSDSRALDHVQLRLGDNEEGKLRLGERYPIETSSYSSGTSASALAGLTGAGSSSSLAALASQYASAYTVPMVEYQDIGLTLKATPRILRSGDVSLNMELKLDSITGSSVNSIPILKSINYSGTVTAKAEHSFILMGEMDKSQSNAVSGTPGLSEIPGLKELSGNDKSVDTSTLLIIITPHIVRSSFAPGATELFRVEKGTVTR